MQEFSAIQKIILYAIPLLFAITLHEASHGYAARHFGDRTAEMLGRLSLNPLRHVDPIGTVVVPLLLVLMSAPFLFGWAKPVPVAFRNLRNPRRDMAVVAAAGPASNLLMALGWALLLKLTTLGSPGEVGMGLAALRAMAQIGVFFNCLLAVFNMLPLPPLDGGRVLSGLLPPRWSDQLDRIEPYGLFIILGLLFFLGLWAIIFPAITATERLIYFMVGL